MGTLNGHLYVQEVAMLRPDWGWNNVSVGQQGTGRVGQLCFGTVWSNRAKSECTISLFLFLCLISGSFYIGLQDTITLL